MDRKRQELTEEDRQKIKKELVEIEDLVYQITFFAHNSREPEYTRVVITNLSKKILDFLQIEYEDIQHLFRHEAEHHNYESHVVNEKSSHIHKTLKEQNEKIKKAVSKIPQLCAKLAEGKISGEEFQSEIEKKCSTILKTAGSEDHELDFVKEFMEQPKEDVS